MNIQTELLRRSENEPFARLLGLEAVEVSPGRAVVRMRARSDMGIFLGLFTVERYSH